MHRLFERGEGSYNTQRQRCLLTDINGQRSQRHDGFRHSPRAVLVQGNVFWTVKSPRDILSCYGRHTFYNEAAIRLRISGRRRSIFTNVFAAKRTGRHCFNVDENR